jgi:transcriptional regulator with XRE-family HTH domain
MLLDMAKFYETAIKQTIPALAENVRALMQKKNWTQQELAKKSGLSQKTISNVLNQKSSTTIGTLDRLGYAFGISPWSLLMKYEDPQDITDGVLPEWVSLFSSSARESREFLIGVARRESKLERSGIGQNQDQDPTKEHHPKRKAG